MQTETLLEFGLAASVHVKLRYLQVQTRTVEQVVGDAFQPVAELEVDGELWASWDEAVEHALDVTGVRPGPARDSRGADHPSRASAASSCWAIRAAWSASAGPSTLWCASSPSTAPARTRSPSCA